MIDCRLSNVQVLEHHIMPAIEQRINDIKINPELVQLAERLAVADTNRERINVRRSEIVGEQKRLDAMFRRGRMSEEIYDRELKRLEIDLGELEPKRPDAVSVAAVKLQSISDAWSALGTESAVERHALLKLLVRQIRIDAREKTVVAFHPHEDFISLFDANRQ